MAENKTNAMRMLDRAKVPYTPHTYETDGEHVDGITVATSIGEPPPSATIKSAPLSLYAADALSTVSTEGFPSVSVKTLLSIPFAFMASAQDCTMPILFK